jgi:hypothetical protein
MVNWHDYLVAGERRQDFIDQARLARLSANGASRPIILAEPSRYERLLIGLGERLEFWGCQLQTRYRKAVLAQATDAMVFSQGQLLAEINNSPCA